MNTQTQVTAFGGKWFTTLRWSITRCAAFVLDLFYPPVCAGCGVAGAGVWCATCDARVARLGATQRLRPLALDAPWQEPWSGAELIVASGARYESPLREAIHALKYDGTPSLAEPLSPLLLDAWRGAHAHADVLVPVPLHARRQRERGYNQSERLARFLGAQCGMPVRPDLLKRVRHTEQQALLKGHERRRNVQGAFTAAGVQGLRVALVDDVFTTGSTLVECTLALLSAGAAGVCALTLARAGE